MTQVRLSRGTRCEESNDSVPLCEVFLERIVDGRERPSELRDLQ